MGVVYLTEHPIDLDSVWNQHASNTDLATQLSLIAKDEVSHETAITVKLHFVRFIDTNQVIKFQQTRYEFRVVESLEANETIGYVNSAHYFGENKKNGSSIIYKIIDGDYFYDEFRLDYESGRLYSVGKLDFEQKQNYTLGILFLFILI